MSCSVAAGCHTKVKRHSFQLIINIMYVHTVRRAGQRAGRPVGVRGTATPPARAPSRAPLDVRFSGSASVRACVQNIFRLKLGRLY